VIFNSLKTSPGFFLRFHFFFSVSFFCSIWLAVMGGGEGPAIGIDLGTCYSCVAVWQNNRVEIITNDMGNRTTPSYVAFNETHRLIGQAAKDQVAVNPTNTVFGEFLVSTPLIPLQVLIFRVLFGSLYLNIIWVLLS
jgi:hypothetical protein